MNDWQPIETAPRNSVDVLIGAWVTYADRGNFSWECTVAKYLYGERGLADPSGKVMSIDKGESWFLQEAGAYAEDYEPSFDPTHWALIPRAPLIEVVK